MEGGLLPRLLPRLPRLPRLPPPPGLEGCWLLDKRVRSWSCNFFILRAIISFLTDSWIPPLYLILTSDKNVKNRPFHSRHALFIFMSLVTCGRELGGGDSPWETGSGCELVVVIIVDSHQLDQLDHIRIATIIIITCDTGSMPILILFALSASFSQARAKSCSASTDVRWGGVGLPC